MDQFQRVSLQQGTATLTFSEGSYIAYYETASLSNGASINLAIRDSATGTPISIAHYGTHLSYNLHGHHGNAVFTFRIPQNGSYDVRYSAPDPNLAAGSDIAFGSSLASGIVGGVLGVTLGGLALVAGIILLIVGFRRRRTYRRQLRAGPGTGYPLGGYPGAGYPPSYPQQN